MSAVLTFLALATAIYAQRQIPRFTATRASTIAARGILAIVGLGCGYVGATLAGEDLGPISAFVVGFGAVHVPAALILLFKRAGDAGKS
jgi:hypothetical protein